MNRLSFRTQRIIYIIIALIIIGGIVYLRTSGKSGITQFNHYSVTELPLGSAVSGIESEADLKKGISGFEYISDEKGVGLKASANDARYYFGRFSGHYCVTGFQSTDPYYSVMSIHIGDSESTVKKLLLEDGFRIKEGGYNSCVAGKGRINIELRFIMGYVIELGAFIE